MHVSRCVCAREDECLIYGAILAVCVCACVSAADHEVVKDCQVGRLSLCFQLYYNILNTRRFSSSFGWLFGVSNERDVDVYFRSYLNGLSLWCYYYTQ